MKVLFVCGVFAKENEQEICDHAKRPVEYSANIFQEKLIHGFEKLGCDISIVSAPFIGSYPNASDIRMFSGFQEKQSRYAYVSFNNIWGIRNFSRASSLKKNFHSFIKDTDPQKLMVVYSVHTPFLDAAVHAKKKDPRIQICMVIPDLPQYMNLDAKVSMVYRIGKQFDIRRFNKLNQYVDSYVLLTDAMKQKLRVVDRPYTVVEGIVDCDSFERNQEKKRALSKKTEEKYIVYTGKLNEKFGVKKLVDAFGCIEDPMCRLVLCGSGDAKDYLTQKAKRDSRIILTGQITHEESLEWVLRADVLVNPRENNEEYTKYSFPSKTIEYLSSGNPTVGFLLDGMSRIYQKFLFTADEKGLAETIVQAMNATPEEKAKRAEAAKVYLQTLSDRMVAERILGLCFDGQCSMVSI